MSIFGLLAFYIAKLCTPQIIATKMQFRLLVIPRGMESILYLALESCSPASKRYCITMDLTIDICTTSLYHFLHFHILSVPRALQCISGPEANRSPLLAHSRHSHDWNSPRSSLLKVSSMPFLTSKSVQMVFIANPYRPETAC